MADWQIDRPCQVWRTCRQKLLHTRRDLSVYFNWNFLSESIDSVLVFSHTRMHCGGERIPKLIKPKPSIWDWKPNRIEPKLQNLNRPSPNVQPHTWGRIHIVWMNLDTNHEDLCGWHITDICRRFLSATNVADKCWVTLPWHTGRVCYGAHVENGRFFRRSSCWNRFIVAIKEKEKDDVSATVDRTQVVEICC